MSTEERWRQARLAYELRKEITPEWNVVKHAITIAESWLLIYSKYKAAGADISACEKAYLDSMDILDKATEQYEAVRNEWPEWLEWQRYLGGPKSENALYVLKPGDV